MSARGFTLLEVIVASGIFCLAVLGLLLALHATVDASRQVERQKGIRSELQSRLARLSLPPLQEFSDDVKVDGVAYHEEIRAEAVSTKTLTAVPGFWRIRVAADWPEGGQRQQWEASHLVYAP